MGNDRFIRVGDTLIPHSRIPIMETPKQGGGAMGPEKQLQQRELGRIAELPQGTFQVLCAVLETSNEAALNAVLNANPEQDIRGIAHLVREHRLSLRER